MTPEPTVHALPWRDEFGVLHCPRCGGCLEPTRLGGQGAHACSCPPQARAA